MTSQASGLGPISQQYAAAATVPLIKSPSLWLPKPVRPIRQCLKVLTRQVELPNDIHPLPEDITAYFVYPFTLETHVLNLRPPPHEAISARRAKNAEILHQREVEEEQREKEALHKLAPGYNPSSLLVPSSKASTSKAGTQDLLSGTLDEAAPQTSGSDPMDDLVARLEEMESKR